MATKFLNIAAAQLKFRKTLAENVDLVLRFIASHGQERDTGHTGNFFNILWSLPGVAQSGPNATGAWMHEFGAWYFDLARRWDGSFSHQGPAELDEDSYAGWDSTGGYLLAYAIPLKKIYLTGKSPVVAQQLDAATAIEASTDLPELIRLK